MTEAQKALIEFAINLANNAKIELRGEGGLPGLAQTINTLDRLESIKATLAAALA